MHVVVVGAGLQYGLPGTWNGMHERGMKPEDVTRLWSKHAAKLAGMQEAGRLHMHVIVVGAGLQYGLPGTWNGMRERGMKPEDVTRLWSTHAAKLAGMQHRKGALAPGMDADIVVGISPHPFSTLRYVASMPASW